MYVGLKQPRGDGERYVTPARAAAKETIFSHILVQFYAESLLTETNDNIVRKCSKISRKAMSYYNLIRDTLFL